MLFVVYVTAQVYRYQHHLRIYLSFNWFPIWRNIARIILVSYYPGLVYINSAPGLVKGEQLSPTCSHLSICIPSSQVCPYAQPDAFSIYQKKRGFCSSILLSFLSSTQAWTNQLHYTDK